MQLVTTASDDIMTSLLVEFRFSVANLRTSVTSGFGRFEPKVVTRDATVLNDT